MAEHAKLFMKVETNTGTLIEGESTVAGFQKQIELEDWSWSLKRERSEGKLSKPGEARKPAIEGLGSIVPEPLRLSKQTDKSTTALLNALTSGQLLRVWITLTEAAQTQSNLSVAFDLVVSLTNVRVLSYSLDGETDDDSGEAKESWVLNYETIRFRYKAPDKAGQMTVELTRKPGDSTDVAERKGDLSDDDIIVHLKKLGKPGTLKLLQGAGYKPASL